MKKTGKNLCMSKWGIGLLVFALAFCLCACGTDDDENDSPRRRDRDKTHSVDKSELFQLEESDEDGYEESDRSDDDMPPGDGTGEEKSGSEAADDAIRSDRHFYKTVVFYGWLQLMYYPASMDYFYGMHGYDSAIVLDYDTSTGKILQKRIVLYYEGTDNERYKDEEEEAKERALNSVGQTLMDLPYTVETFYYHDNNYPDVPDDKINALVWVLPEDFDPYAFEQYMADCFLFSDVEGWGQRERQDIDGFIKYNFYNDLPNSNPDYKPYPYFGSNFFNYDSANIHYTIAWYDTAWTVDIPDPTVELFENMGYPDYSMPWDASDYGSTSYNTGGGYSGTYRYEDGVQ